MKTPETEARCWPDPVEKKPAINPNHPLTKEEFSHLAFRQSVVRHIMRVHGVRQDHAKQCADWLLSLLNDSVEKFR